MVLSVYCDGGARGNPGPGAVGVVIKDKNNEMIYAFGKKIGIATNNVAEYTAVIEGLDWVLKNITINKSETVQFFLDSQLVVSQLSGIFKVKDPKLRTLLLAVRQKEAQLGGNIFYRHIPREENTQADKFVNQALDNIGYQDIKKA